MALYVPALWCVARGKCRSAGVGTRNNIPYRRTPVLVSPRRSRESTYSAINVSQPRMNWKDTKRAGGKRNCTLPGIKSALSYYNRIMASRSQPRLWQYNKNECCHAGLSSTLRRRRPPRCGRRNARKCVLVYANVYGSIRYLDEYNGKKNGESSISERSYSTFIRWQTL